MRVSVHKNLTTQKWVMYETKITRNGERKDPKKRIGDIESCTLENVTFVIPTQKSFDRVKAQCLDKTTKYSREVIAYAIGDLCVLEDGTPWDADPAVINCAVKWDHLGETGDFRDEDGNVISDKTFQRMYFYSLRDLDGHSVVAL